MAVDLNMFDDWNGKKKQLQAARPKALFKEGQIWWCSLGINIGEEVLGKGKMYRRPVIIIRKITHTSCVVVPTTTQTKHGSWYYPFEANNLKRWAMLHQIRFISSKRLHNRESSLYDSELKSLKKAVKKFYGL